MNNKVIRYLVGAMVIGILALHSKYDLRLLREIEYKLYDARLRLTAPSGIDPRVVIIDIDETSLAKLGQWPWNRDVIATIIDNLFDHYGLEVLGMDNVFPEPDTDSTLIDLKSVVTSEDIAANPSLGDLVERRSRDEVFAESLAKHDVVTGYAFGIRTDQVDTGLLPPPMFGPNLGLTKLTDAPEASRYTSNLALLQKSNDGGFFSLSNGVDSDGIIRRIPLLNKYKDALYPALSLVVAQHYLGADITPVIADTKTGDKYHPLEGLDFGYFSIDVDAESAVFVPYRKDKNSFRYISAYDVYSKNVENADDLAGVVGLFGASAAGLLDIRATPVSNVFPGVEVHANMIASLLDGEFKRYPAWAKGAELLLLLLVGSVLLFMLPSLSAIWMTIISVLALAGLVASNFFLWQKFNFILSLAPILSMTAMLYFFNMVYGFLLESKSRKLLKRSFGLYVPPEIIEKMQGESVSNLLRSEKKEMTVLFTDIRGFTTISEQMDPAALSELMNRFLTPMTEIVHQTGGAVDKYMGDAMMAFWGAPIEDEDHATHGIQAALKMIDSLEQLNKDFSEKGWPQVNIGVGLNTGSMSVGNMGSEFRIAYTVLGDAVNLGSRLEGLTKQYGVQILFSEYTASLAKNVEVCELDQVRVKGKNEPVKIFYPLGLTGEVSTADLHYREHFRRGLACYRNQNWVGAKDTIQPLFDQTGAELYKIYLERVSYFEQNPPAADWDGVFDFETK